MQEGTDRWQAAGLLGITLEQLENGYGPIIRSLGSRGGHLGAVAATKVNYFKT